MGAHRHVWGYRRPASPAGWEAQDAFLHYQQRRYQGAPLENGSRSHSPGLPSRGVVSSFWVDICDSAFSPRMVLLLPRPSRDHGSGRHGDRKGRMEMLPAALCVSGFRSASSAFGSLSLPSSPSAQHSGAGRAVPGEGNDLRRGEGVPGATTAPWLPAMSTHQSLWMVEVGRVVVPRAFAGLPRQACLFLWLFFSVLFFYLCPASFWLSCSRSSSSASSSLSCSMSLDTVNLWAPPSLAVEWAGRSRELERLRSRDTLSCSRHWPWAR